MQKYTDKASIPLKFHAFYRYVLLPLNFAFLLYSFLQEIKEMTFFHWTFVVIVISYIIIITSLVIIFIGFYTWRPYGWYAIYVSLIASLAYNCFAAFILIAYDSAQAAYSAGVIFGSLLRLGLIGLYYAKRKVLFFPNEVEIID